MTPRPCDTPHCTHPCRAQRRRCMSCYAYKAKHGEYPSRSPGLPQSDVPAPIAYGAALEPEYLFRDELLDVLIQEAGT